MGILWIILTGLVAGLHDISCRAPTILPDLFWRSSRVGVWEKKIVLPPEPCIGRLRHAAIPSQWSAEAEWSVATLRYGGMPMFLSRIEPADEANHDRRTFECPTCRHSQTVTVKYK